MTATTPTAPAPHALRRWPGVSIVVAQWLAVFGTGWLAPGSFWQFFGHMAGMVLGLALFFGWWLWASRAPRDERLIGAILPPLAFVAAMPAMHPGARVAAMIYGPAFLGVAFLGWALLGRAAAPARRRRALIGLVVAYCGFWLAVRSSGVEGDFGMALAWRFAPTAEERLLATAAGPATTAAGPSADAAETVVSWPGFRGTARDGVAYGTGLATDWDAVPPTTRWRRPVGPGWSSFAVAEDALFTQEQRGDDELVVRYRAATGEPVWQHRNPARFTEPMAGPGPRATPTLAGGRLYALGATGLLDALDPATGAVSWTRDVAADAGAPIPEWGFASSPLVFQGLVVVSTGGAGGRGAVAYDAATGEPRWLADVPGATYTSAHPARFGGVDQLLISTGAGLFALEPATGRELWRHEWPVPGGARIVQPAILGDGVLIGTGFGVGVRRLAIARDGDGWHAEERWTSGRLKPYFNDMVVHEGHVFGFDGRILACLDLETGERVWKGGRYGSGQLLLLADQDLLLVVSERGEVGVVAAAGDGFRELARADAISGKTWNHPVLVDGVLYLRNGEEMAALRLPS